MAGGRKQFFQLCCHVDYIQNKKLEERFLAQKKKFQQAGKQDGEVMLWHATRFFKFHKHKMIIKSHMHKTAPLPSSPSWATTSTSRVLLNQLGGRRKCCLVVGSTSLRCSLWFCCCLLMPDTAKSVFADADPNQRCQRSLWCTATPWSSAEWPWEPARTSILSLDTEFWHSGRSGFPKMRMTNWFSRLKTLQPNVHCAIDKCDLRLFFSKYWT